MFPDEHLAGQHREPRRPDTGVQDRARRVRHNSGLYLHVRPVQWHQRGLLIHLGVVVVLVQQPIEDHNDDTTSSQADDDTTAATQADDASTFEDDHDDTCTKANNDGGGETTAYQ